MKRLAGLGPALTLAALLLAPAALAAPPPRELLDVRVFARIGEPGQPEPVAIGLPEKRVYVGTNQQGRGDADAPSKVFVYSRKGKLLRDFTLEGQPLEQAHGIQGLAFDGPGRLYVLDRSATPRVVRLNVRTGRQGTWARFPDVPSCGDAPADGECSATVGDQPPGPDYGAFGPDGRFYVSDIDQALVWRVPRKGGRARVWFTDPLLENVFGPNGLQFMADGRTLLLAVTATGPSGGDVTSGGLYEIPLRRDGSAGEIGELWRSRPFDGPDGFAIARSGDIYLALAGASQLAVISPQGEELARVPANPFQNSMMEVPFDGPASVAFLGRRVLVTNQSFPAGNPSSWAVLDVYAGERGLPLYRP